MRKRFKKIISCVSAVIVAVSAAIATSGCSDEPGEVRLNDFFGAPVVMVFSEPIERSVKNKLVSEIDDMLSSVEKSVSLEQEESCIYRFNSGERPVKIDQTAYSVLSAAQRFYSETDGKFDPTTEKLTDLWGFSKRHKTTGYAAVYPYDRERNKDGSFDLPDGEYISAFSLLADFSKINIYDRSENGETEYYLDDDRFSVTVDGTTYFRSIDLSGVAKGYASDMAEKIISEMGVKGVYVSFGGSSMYLTDRSGDSYDLGIVDPFSPFRSSFATLKVKNKFVATSGTYENSYYLDGVRYHHVIDPDSGFPSDSDLVSVTLIGDSGAEVDALSTAMLIFGSEKAIKTLEDKRLKFVLVTADRTVFTNVATLSAHSEEYKVNYIE